MTDSIEELSLRWKQNPDPAGTIALCDALRGAAKPTLVQQVGDFATQNYGDNVPVLTAVARMYMNTHKLAEAQSVLVAAGKIAPRDGNVYRVLGEVLLRRGDADRSEKVFERAGQFGAGHDTQIWLERARIYKTTQAKAGVRAVAAEVARVHPTGPDVIRLPMDSFESETEVRPQLELNDAVSTMTTAEEHTVVSSSPKPIQPLRVPASATSRPPPMPSRPAPAPARQAPVKSSVPPAVPHVPPKARSLPPPLPSLDLASELEPPLPSLSTGPRKFPANIETADSFEPTAPEAFMMPASQLPNLAASANPFLAPSVVHNGASSHSRSERPAHQQPSRRDEVPHAQDVLDALALAGVFEPPARGSADANWARAETKPRRKPVVFLAIVMTLIVGGAAFGYKRIRDDRVKAHTEAENTLNQVEIDIDKSQAALLPNVEQQFSHVFDLDSRSERASIDWLHERAMSGLLKGGSDLAFEDNVQRARELQIPEDKFAFALMSSFLFQGDTGGAAALLSKWDPRPASQDAWYQLISGAVLDRAGDARARARYEAATKLNPSLVIAQIALVRATAIDGDPMKAADLAKGFRARYPERVEGPALVALAWARDPSRGDQPPPEVAETISKADALPVSLKAVPRALSALLAIDKHDLAKAKDEVQAGLGLADGPGMAAWLGIIALDTGDESLARKGALAAVQFSAVYPPARVLAARVALLGNRLDEALKATEELDANSPDVAVVRAATAYERVDGAGLGSALEAVPVELRKLPFLAALTLAQSALAGRVQMSSDKLLELADDDAPWSDLVAMDLALTTADIDTADKIAVKWKGTEDRALHALRLSQLARYHAKLDEADKLSLTALNGGTITPRTLLERSLVMVARDKGAEVGPLLAKYPLVLGQVNATWLSAFALASLGKVDDARGKTAQLDAPPPLAPVPVRIIAAISCGAMHDRRRGTDLIKDLFSRGIIDPDVANAGTAVGLHAPARSRR